jgi:hypothetical protein
VQAPDHHARSSGWAGRPSPWAPAEEDEYGEEDPYAPAEELPPPPPAHTDARPADEGPADDEVPAASEQAQAAGGDWLPPLFPQEWPPEPAREEWTPLAPPEERGIPAQRRIGPSGAPAVPPPGTSAQRSSATAWWIATGVIIVALAVAAGILVGLSLAARGGGEDGAAGATCGGRKVLRTAVTPEFAPVVERAATDIGADPAGGCRLIAITSQAAPTRDGEAWIPATAAWAQVARFQYMPEPVSLARSPVVVAAPRPFAESLGWPGKQPTWAALAAGIGSGQIPRFSMGSPLDDTAGLLAATGLQSAMAKTTDDPGIAQMRALSVRARLADAESSPAKLLERMAQQGDPVKALREVGLFPVLEQDLWRYAQSRRPVAVAALYPPDGLLEADYPLLLTPAAARDGELKALANRLTDRIRGKEFAPVLAGRGLRPAAQPAGAPAAPSAEGLIGPHAAALDLPGGVPEWAATWAQYKRLAYHTLLLVDASGSMNDEVRDRSGGVTTKAGLLRSAGVQAAQLFGEETSLGVWMFASPAQNAPPFTVALPFGPMTDKVGDVPRREAIRQVAANYKAFPAAGTPLFETVLRGVGDMKERFEPDAVNIVVVLTDGRDEDSRFAMPKDQFIARLGGLRDPARPVMVFAIGYGGDADMAVLRRWRS